MTFKWTPELKAMAEEEARRKTRETGQRWEARWIDNYDDTAMRGRYVIERT